MAKRKSIGRAEFLYVRMAYLAQLSEEGHSPQESARIVNVDPVQVSLLLDTFDNFDGPLPGEELGDILHLRDEGKQWETGCIKWRAWTEPLAVRLGIAKPEKLSAEELKRVVSSAATGTRNARGK